jgi:hypothetical protein
MRVLPRITSGIMDTVLSYNDGQLRLLSKADMEEINKALERLLNRKLTPKEFGVTYDKFVLDTSLKRFRSPIMERKVNGMMHLQEVINNVAIKKYSTQQTATSPAVMLQWLHENQILEECFGKHSHHELMRRTTDIFKFIAAEHALDIKHIGLLWGAMEQAMKRGDDATLTVLYKVLDDIAWHLEVTHVDFLFAKLAAIPMAELTVAALELMKELSRWTYKAGAGAAASSLEIMWRIIQDDSSAANDLVLAAKTRIEDTIGVPNARRHRNLYLEHCVNNLKAGRAIPQSLGVLVKVMISPVTISLTFN